MVKEADERKKAKIREKVLKNVQIESKLLKIYKIKSKNKRKMTALRLKAEVSHRAKACRLPKAL